MGRLEAAHSSDPSGRPAARSRASLGSLGASSASRMADAAADAAASAASHDASHPVLAGRAPASRTAAATDYGFRITEDPGPV